MTYKYTLYKTDYLVHQLYHVSTNPASKKRKLRNWILCTLVFLFFALFFYKQADTVLMWYFFGAALITSTLYPYYHKWRYKSHYQRHIKENYSDFFNKIVSITFTDDAFITKDKVAESRVAFTELKQINELKNHILLQVSKGLMLIVPKTDSDEFVNFKLRLTEISKIYDIKWKDETTWQWN